MALACKAIARTVAYGELADAHGSAGGELNVQGEEQKRLDVISNDLFVRLNEWGGRLAGMASEEMARPHQIPAQFPRGRYLLVFNPLDGSSNTDVNVSVGSIFSILRAPNRDEFERRAATSLSPDFLQPGSQQVAAGYAIYGPSTMLVLSVGRGVSGFTLDPGPGEFMLTHPTLQVPPQTQEFAINSSNSRFWEPPIRRFVDECLAGRNGPARQGLQHALDRLRGGRGTPHPDARRRLHVPQGQQGPREGRPPAPALRGQSDRLPDRAGGRPRQHRSAAGAGPDRQAELHQRVGLVFGSSDEVERIERYHHEPTSHDSATPLFAERGLFRVQA